MRKNKFYRILTIVFVLALTLVPIGTAFAQDTTTITFAGQPLTGSADELTDLLMSKLRPAVATAGKPMVVKPHGTFAEYTPDTCFGVSEELPNGQYLLRETMYKTDMSNGRYDAVVPPTGEHGDWPPHLVNFTIESTQPLGCDELTAEVSYRIRYTPDAPGALAYTFNLDPEFLAETDEHANEYATMASGGQLGLFVASPVSTVMTVNGETMESQGCSDCLAHTRATTDTIGAGIYSPATVEWFGEVTEDAPALREMYVLPVPATGGVDYTVTIELGEEAFEDGRPLVFLWFGRFDMPR